MIDFVINFSVGTAIFYLLYLLLFKHLSFFRWNRFTLLLIPILAASITPIGEFLPSTGAFPIFVNLPELTVLAEQTQAPSSNEVSMITLFMGAYIIGVAVFLIRLLIGLLLLSRYRKSAKRISTHGVSFWRCDKAAAPYAFLGEIFIPTALIDSPHLQQILLHEQAHVAQRHGADNLYYGILLILFWPNPFIHLLFRELRQVHECLADEYSLEHASRENYSLFLLDNLFGKDVLLPAIGFFNSSFIKTRITMIYKKKSADWKKMAYLLVLPLSMILLVFACGENEMENTRPTEPLQAEEPRVEEDKQHFGPQEVDKLPSPLVEDDAGKSFYEILSGHISENLQYPEEAKLAGAEGMVYLSFIINAEGNVDEVEAIGAKLTSSLKPKTTYTEEQLLELMKNAAEQALKSAPRIAPAVKDGKLVSVKLNLPIRFSLEN